MRAGGIAVIFGLMLLAGTAGGTSLRAQPSPSASVFQLFVITGSYHGSQTVYYAVTQGTAFFISADGTALTNSHVVYPARTQPVTYQLIALVDGEFYGASLICATALPEDPMKANPHGVETSRDVAEIRLTRPQFPFSQFGTNNTPYAIAHVGALPRFPALELGANPSVGDAVRVLGYGRISSSVPYAWSAQGTVSRMLLAADGTPLLAIRFGRGVEPGDSGAPVLNSLDQAVGILSWMDPSDHTLGYGISRVALNPACQ
ncbi:MAG TPA: serine protease [bacterium]|nr:serine protease [bacterium]